MNSKTLVLTSLLGLLLLGLTGVRLTHQAAGDEITSTANSDDSVELIWSFEIRIRLPIIKKDAP